MHALWLKETMSKLAAEPNIIWDAFSKAGLMEFFIGTHCFESEDDLEQMTTVSAEQAEVEIASTTSDSDSSVYDCEDDTLSDSEVEVVS